MLVVVAVVALVSVLVLVLVLSVGTVAAAAGDAVRLARSVGAVAACLVLGLEVKGWGTGWVGAQDLGLDLPS